jgi:hypothetical protein
MIRDLARYGKHSRAAFRRVVAPGLVLFMQCADDEKPDGLFRCLAFDGDQVDYEYRRFEDKRRGTYQASWDWLADLSWSLASDADWILGILEE